MKELTPEFIAFIKKAHRACPSLFYSSTENQEENEADTITRQALFTDLHAVFLAWKRLKQMTSSHQKWSESDYATNVYNVFRSPAVRHSSYRYAFRVLTSR
jgi:solute carrier family 25 carnitine/acylcarnitine transporter 20/29